MNRGAVNHEIASGWYKSSYSDTGANCVETASIKSGGRAVRDSKDLRVGHLAVPAAAWEALTAALRG
jgi:hypothetical protein